MGQTIRFFDGGAGGTANPPTRFCVEAFEYDGFTAADTRLVALGTGYFPASGDPPKGLLQTIGWTTSTLVDTSEDWVDDAVKRQWLESCGPSTRSCRAISTKRISPPFPRWSRSGRDGGRSGLGADHRRRVLKWRPEA